MPHDKNVSFEVSPSMERVLEGVRQQQGLDTLDQAAEYLTRYRIRNAAKKTAGPRALYPVKGGKR